LDVGARSVAKNFKCQELEPEPEPEIRVPDPLLQSTIRTLHLLRQTYFCALTLTKILRILSKFKHLRLGFNGYNSQTI